MVVILAEPLVLGNTKAFSAFGGTMRQAPHLPADLRSAIRLHAHPMPAAHKRYRTGDIQLGNVAII